MARARGHRSLNFIAAAAMCLGVLAPDCTADGGQGPTFGPAPQPPAQAQPDAATPSVAPASTAPSSEDHRLGDPAAARGTPDHHQAASSPSSGAAGKPWIGQTLLSLGAVLGLAVIAAAVMRALARGQGGLRGSLGAGGRAPAGLKEILGRYPVGRGATLVLLKLDRRVLLLSQSAGGRLGAGAGFQTLCEITDPEEVASILVKSRDAEGDSMSERFRSILGRFDRNMEAVEEDSGRRVTQSGSGDRAELWDERNPIPVVDLTRQPGPPDQSAAGSLRRRLASMRGAGDGGGRA